jgi:hypothetical protein
MWMLSRMLFDADMSATYRQQTHAGSTGRTSRQYRPHKQAVQGCGQKLQLQSWQQTLAFRAICDCGGGRVQAGGMYSLEAVAMVQTWAVQQCFVAAAGQLSVPYPPSLPPSPLRVPCL